MWRTGDTGALTELLAEGVTFSSPVTDYHGRENAAHVLGLIATSLYLGLRIAAHFEVPVEVIFSTEPFPRLGTAATA